MPAWCGAARRRLTNTSTRESNAEPMEHTSGSGRYASGISFIELAGAQAQCGPACWVFLTNSDLASNAVDQLPGIVADSALEHGLDVLDLCDCF
jgi:hypothetical protein